MKRSFVIVFACCLFIMTQRAQAQTSQHNVVKGETPQSLSRAPQHTNNTSNATVKPSSSVTMDTPSGQGSAGNTETAAQKTAAQQVRKPGASSVHPKPAGPKR